MYRGLREIIEPLVKRIRALEAREAGAGSLSITTHNRLGDRAFNTEYTATVDRFVVVTFRSRITNIGTTLSGSAYASVEIDDDEDLITAGGSCNLSDLTNQSNSIENYHTLSFFVPSGSTYQVNISATGNGSIPGDEPDGWIEYDIE